MLKSVETSVATLVKAGLPVMFVTEDTTRAAPETLQKLYDTAIAANLNASAAVPRFDGTEFVDQRTTA